MDGKTFYTSFAPHDPRIENSLITGTLQKSVEMSDWNPSKRLFVNKHLVAAGSRVRIVMLSRLGDLGITDRMDDHVGYSVRVHPDCITDITVVPRGNSER